MHITLAITSLQSWHPGFGYATLRRVLATKTTAQWLAFCREHGIPAGPAAGLDELIGALPEAEHPQAGRHKLVPPPVRFSRTPTSVRLPAPLPGQHTHLVLTEAGLTEAEIAELAEAGVLGTPDETEPTPRPRA